MFKKVLFSIKRLFLSVCFEGCGKFYKGFVGFKLRFKEIIKFVFLFVK